MFSPRSGDERHSENNLYPAIILYNSQEQRVP